MVAAEAREGDLVRLRISARGCGVKAGNALLPLGCNTKVLAGAADRCERQLLIVGWLLLKLKGSLRKYTLEER